MPLVHACRHASTHSQMQALRRVTAKHAHAHEQMRLQMCAHEPMQPCTLLSIPPTSIIPTSPSLCNIPVHYPLPPPQTPTLMCSYTLADNGHTPRHTHTHAHSLTHAHTYTHTSAHTAPSHAKAPLERSAPGIARGLPHKPLRRGHGAADQRS